MTTRTDPGSSSAVTPTVPSPEALVGKRVNKYDVVRVIGRGGMGTVYEAMNTAIGKRVAMKFIDGDAVQNSAAVARFQREAQAASAVESAHIVDIFDAGISEDGQPYIVMELLRGEDLGHRIKRCGRLELPEALHLTAQILRGLHRAHNAGIVHRDLKPDNIFLVDRDDDPDFAKILDFGISKVRRQGETPVNTLTRQGTVLGTPFYMSPEQAQAQPDVDARSDLWSVGAILYECLTGRPPYTGATYEQVIVNICMNDADDVRVFNPAVPEPVASVIARALARDRDQRFHDARELLEALRAASGVSLRGGSGASEDSFPGVTSSDPGSTPVTTRRTPSTPDGRARSPAADDPSLDATMLRSAHERSSSPRHRSTPPSNPPRQGSLITRRRAAATRRRRMFLLVTVAALFVGGFSASLFTRTWALLSEHATDHPAEASLPAAPAAPPLVRPVRAAEPEGAPTSPEPSPSFVLPVSPPVDAVEAKSRPPKIVHNGGPPTTTQSSTRAPPPRPPETAAPATSGVAPGLKLKTD